MIVMMIIIYGPARDVDEVLCTSTSRTCTQSVRPEIENRPLGLSLSSRPWGLKLMARTARPHQAPVTFFFRYAPALGGARMGEGAEGWGGREGLTLKLEGAAAIDVAAPRTRTRSNERCAVRGRGGREPRASRARAGEGVSSRELGPQGRCVA